MTQSVLVIYKGQWAQYFSLIKTGPSRPVFLLLLLSYSQLEG